MRTSSRLGIVAGLALGAMAFSPHVAAMSASRMVQQPEKLFESRSRGRGSMQRDDYRNKPWTCTAIEKRKAAKRRNVKRCRARRRA